VAERLEEAAGHAHAGHRDAAPQLQGADHGDQGAQEGGECVGIACWIALADEPAAAEVAVTVTDRYQGRGIGRLLVGALQSAAVGAGLTTLVYMVDPTNRPALRLLRSLDGELAFRDGLVQGRQRLPGRPLMEHPPARVWRPADGLAALGHPQGQLLEGPGDMQPPGGVTQAAPQLAVDADDRAGDKRVGPAGIVAVDGENQADPGPPGPGSSPTTPWLRRKRAARRSANPR
jgi:GNAT superfamily N-acetyltransferase